MESSKLDLIIWGKHPVLSALSCRFVRTHEILASLKKDTRLREELREQAGLKGTPIHESSDERLERFSKTTKHQGVVARITMDTFSSLRDWFEHVENRTRPLLGVALDDVQDPQNVGTLWRAAGFFGADVVLMTRDRSAPVTGVVVKASAGAVFRVPLVRAVNLARELEAAAEFGFWRIGLAADEGRSLTSVPFERKPVLVVLGNEFKGLRDLTRRKCDEVVRITGSGGMESLNVAVAGAIALYEVVRQLGR